MKLNIFRNPFIDAQVSMLMQSYDDAVRNSTEEYWRKEIAWEVINRCPHEAVCQECLDISESIMKGKS